MYNNLQKILANVLEIISFPDNKKEFIDTFRKQCRQLTVIKLIKQLPKEKQEELKQRITKVSTGEEGKEIIMSYFPQHLYEETLNKAAKNYFSEYIQDILTKLEPATKSDLQVYLQEIQNFLYKA